MSQVLHDFLPRVILRPWMTSYGLQNELFSYNEKIEGERAWFVVRCQLINIEVKGTYLESCFTSSVKFCE